VGYATSDGTAQAPADYTSTSGVADFLAEETSTSFTVPLVADASDEPNRTVNLALSPPVNATLGSPVTAVLTILDDDDPPKVQFSETGPTVNESAGMATITVTLSAPSAYSVTVEHSTGDGTAIAGSDYLAANDLVSFNPGDVEKSFSVPIIDDGRDESNETVHLTLSSPSNATLGSPAASTLIIVDDEGAPTVQFSSASYSVMEGDGTAVVQATLSAPSGHSVSVGYSTFSGTADDDGDYADTSGTLMFPPGVISKTFSISIVDDALDESDESLNLFLHDPVNALLGFPEAGTLTIVDNDDPPPIQFETGEYNTVENAGTVALTITLNAASELTVTVEVAVVGGTAKDGIDYTGPANSLTFAPGTTAQFLQIALTDDSEVEPHETVFLMLSDPYSATLGTPDLARLTIEDDDGTVTYLAILRR
jgi:hypothetical protein